MVSSSSNNFLDFLRDQLGLDESAVPRASEWAESGNTIGMLALKLNLLTVTQIDQILVDQEQWTEPNRAEETQGPAGLFGQIAVRLGLLSGEQVAQLLKIQDVNRNLELGQLLVMAGTVEMDELLRHLSDFLRHREGCGQRPQEPAAAV